jgi:hypothetical protein
MTAIYIALGIVLGIATLVGLCLTAGLLVAALYALVPVVQAWDIDLSLPVFVIRWRAVVLPPVPPVDVVLCRQPLTNTEYFITIAHGLPMWSKRKGHAMRFSLADRMALEVLFRKYGLENVFVVYAEPVEGQ